MSYQRNHAIAQYFFPELYLTVSLLRLYIIHLFFNTNAQVLKISETDKIGTTFENKHYPRERTSILNKQKFSLHVLVRLLPRIIVMNENIFANIYRLYCLSVRAVESGTFLSMTRSREMRYFAEGRTWAIIWGYHIVIIYNSWQYCAATSRTWVSRLRMWVLSGRL